MDISKKSLIVITIIDLLLLAISVVCLYATKFNIVSIILISISVICIVYNYFLVYKFGKYYKK